MSTSTAHPGSFTDAPELYDIMASPVGELLLTASARGVTRLLYPPRSGTHSIDASWARENDIHVTNHAAADAVASAREWLVTVRAQLAEYFAGARQEFAVALAPTGTPFQQQVWTALRTIPYGHTWSYGQLARGIDRPTAVRAVGLANGRNPISIIVPCHRVIGANGSLTGYGGGLERKRWLLALEAAGG